MKPARYLLSLVVLLCFIEVSLPNAIAQQTGELSKIFLSLKARAENGNADAQYNFGMMYAKGNGVANASATRSRDSDNVNPGWNGRSCVGCLSTMFTNKF